MSDTSHVWEGTVGIALRDTQWMTLGSAPTPNLYVSLTGKVEKHAGDVAFAHEQRFFLFELKGSRTGIRTEWMKLVRGVAHDNEPAPLVRKVKQAHKFALDLAMTWQRRPDGASTLKLIRSIRCHHFVYWKDRAVSDHDRTSGLVVSPYLLATLIELARQQKEGAEKIEGQDASAIPVDQLWQKITGVITLTMRGVDRYGAVESRVAHSVPISAVYDGRAEIAHQKSVDEVDRYKLGLTAGEFKLYADDLMLGVKSGEDILNAVVLGTHGFNRSFNRLRDIADIFAHPTPAPSVHPSI